MVIPMFFLEVSLASSSAIKMTASTEIVLSDPASRTEMGAREGSMMRTTIKNMTMGGLYSIQKLVQSLHIFVYGVDGLVWRLGVIPKRDWRQWRSQRRRF